MTGSVGGGLNARGGLLRGLRFGGRRGGGRVRLVCGRAGGGRICLLSRGLGRRLRVVGGSVGGAGYGRDDGKFARRDTILDRGLERSSRRNPSGQAADRDRLDLARVNGRAGLADDRRGVGVLTRQLDLLAGEHQVVALVLGALTLDIKVVLGHASSLFLPTYYEPSGRSRALVPGRPLIRRRFRRGIPNLCGT